MKVFTEEVAERLNKVKWNIPKKWDSQIDKIIQIYVDKDIKTVDKIIIFVKAQFYVFDVNLSKQLFKMKYPPIGVFGNSNSFKRYTEYINLEFATIKKKIDVATLVRNEYNRANCSKTGNVDIDKLKLCIMNGAVSVYTVAYIFIKYNFSSELCKEIASLVRSCREENIYHKYNEIKFLIERGELDAK